MMAASMMFHRSGLDKQAFLAGVAQDPQTYTDWEGNGWTVETSGKEDAMFSPLLRKPFDKAREAGVIPSDMTTIGGTWGAISDNGDLRYMNVLNLGEIDGTDVRSLTKGEIEGRHQAMMAIEAIRCFTPGAEQAKLRNFGMTIGIRDTRKIDALYNMTAHDVREQGRFDDSIGNLLVTGRSIGRDRDSDAAARNMMCCAVAPLRRCAVAPLRGKGPELPPQSRSRPNEPSLLSTSLLSTSPVSKPS
jgi:hypothetical protein